MSGTLDESKERTERDESAESASNPLGTRPDTVPKLVYRVELPHKITDAQLQNYSEGECKLTTGLQWYPTKHYGSTDTAAYCAYPPKGRFQEVTEQELRQLVANGTIDPVRDKDKIKKYYKLGRAFSIVSGKEYTKRLKVPFNANTLFGPIPSRLDLPKRQVQANRPLRPQRLPQQLAVNRITNPTVNTVNPVGSANRQPIQPTLPSLPNFPIPSPTIPVRVPTQSVQPVQTVISRIGTGGPPTVFPTYQQQQQPQQLATNLGYGAGGAPTIPQQLQRQFQPQQQLVPGVSTIPSVPFAQSQGQNSFAQLSQALMQQMKVPTSPIPNYNFKAVGKSGNSSPLSLSPPPFEQEPAEESSSYYSPQPQMQLASYDGADYFYSPHYNDYDRPFSTVPDFHLPFYPTSFDHPVRRGRSRHQ